MTEIPRHIDVTNPDFFRSIAPNLPPSMIESLVINEQEERLKERAPGKYNFMFLALSIYKRMRAPYHVGRIIDDQADGDQDIPQGFSFFEEYIGYLKRSLDTNGEKVLEGGAAEFLMLRSVESLERFEQTPGETRGEAHRFLDAMLSEYNRRTKREILTRDELKQRYQETFGPPQNIAFIAVGSPVRSVDIPELALAQGMSFAVKDLKPELKREICNIPSETLDEAGLNLSQLIDDPDLVEGSKVIQLWIQHEQSEAIQLVEKLWKEKLDPGAWIMVRFLTMGVKRKYKSP